MKKLHVTSMCCCGLLLFVCLSSAFAEEYTAFSLSTAQKLIESRRRDSTVDQVGGMTHPVAAIYDKGTDDVILVGEKISNQAPVSIDDWAVAVRAVLQVRQDPAVSIDRTDETARTRKQIVRFAGGLEDTQFGKDLLAADVVLKRLGLKTLTADIFDLSSYLDLSAREFETLGKQNPVVSRFWFLPDTQSAKVTVQDGLILAEEYRILVKNEILSSEGDGGRDRPAEAFAQEMYGRFQDVKLYFPELVRLEQLYYITALAQGLESSGMSESSVVSYWLNEFKVKSVPTPREFPLEENSAPATFKDAKVTIIVSGGVDFDVMVYRLQSGGIEDIKNYVIQSRPSPGALSWEVPLLTCVLDTNYDPSQITAIKASENKKAGRGMSLMREFRPASPASILPPMRNFSIPDRPLPSQFNTIGINNHLSQMRLTRTPNVGGVMLENVARVKDDNPGNPLDMAGASFSFIVDGKDAQLDPQTFRKFVTALWAVYYSNEDPGISIDPIAPGAEKHLVRYIGQVINTDLGRVMREADYLMKKWSVGTEDPKIAGFKSPLDYAADQGMLSVGAWSRFWFVPKDMQFRRADNVLLFESGRMTVQTEYMFQGVGAGADPANLKFAEFFTDHYEEIAEKYPVYAELYEYAKMVSLAKYLKESGVPLFWFLMANKDLVITEDSVGTVDALFKDSRRFEGVSVEGGVELRSEGQYIYDNEAVSAISAAIRNAPAPTVGTTSIVGTPGSIRAVSDPFTFALKNRSFSVLPQHTSSSSKDYRGLRYQTDFALKEAGYQLTDESWRDLRQAIFRITFVKLLYEASENSPSEDISLIQTESWRKAEALSDDITDNLRQILNQDFESEARFYHAVEKCLPPALAEEWKALITKYAFYNTTLELVRCYHPHSSSEGLFGAGWDLLVPYRLKASGEEKVELGNAVLPKRMAIRDRLSGREEVLTFSDSRFQAAAYVPDDVKSSQVVGLFIMSDGSFRLLDKIENEFEFDAAGYLTKMIFSEVHQIAIEYQKDFAARLDTPPYKIERASTKWVQFRSVNLPERLRVKSLTDESSEEFIFTEDKAVVGYAPVDPRTSRFEFLALMSDLSYRLVAKNEDEMAFNQSGTFEKLISTSEQCLVKSMSSGNYTVEFGYTLNKVGKPVIAEASLVKAGASEPQVTMQYSYDSEGRLSAATTVDPEAEVTRRDQTEDQIENISRGILAKQM